MPLRSPRPRPTLRRARLIVPIALVALASAAAAQPALDAAPATPEADFEDARVLYDGGTYAAAARAFDRFLERYPRDPRAPEALFLQAESALAADDDLLAAELFARFEARYPGHPFAARARLALGRYYYDRGLDAQAEDALAAAAAASGSPEARAEAGYLLGLVQRRQGRPDAAAAALGGAAEADTRWAAPALYALGSVWVEEEDWAPAADAFATLRDRYPDSPEDVRAGLALAEALVRTGRLREGADEAARRRAALAGDDAARGALLEGETRLRLGGFEAADAALADVPSDSRYARRAALARGRVAVARAAYLEAADFFRIARAGVADLAQDDALAHEAAYYEGLAMKRLGQLADAGAALEAASTRRPDGPYADPALLELGLLRYERRLYDEAARAFGRLLERNPRGPFAGEAARMLGESYAALGQTERARDAFRRAEELGTATAETRAEVAFQDAYALYQNGQTAEAVEALLAVAAADPTGPRAGEALFWAGEAAFQTGEYARSEGVLRDFLRRFPDHPRADAARYVIAWTLYQRERTADAARAFEEFLSAYSRAGGELVPYYADALLRLGDLYTVLGRYEDARLVYGRVPEATPDRQGGDYALFQTAQAFGREGRTADAIRAYDRLLREYPQSERYAQALLAQGALYTAQGSDSLAVAAYDRVLRERPQSGAAALLGVGDVQVNRGDYAAAEATYRRVLERYPASALTVDAFSGLADALEAQGRGGEIDDVFSEVDRSLSGLEGRARLRYARAQLALTTGEDSLAVVLLEEVLTAAPPDLEQDALLALGGAYALSGRFPDAVRALRRLVVRYPEGPLAGEAQLRLAEALLQTGDARGALDTAARLRGLEAIDPGRAADGLAVEALALEALGRVDEADAVLRELVRRYPDSAAAEAALRDRPDLEAPDAGLDGSGPDDADNAP